MDKRRVILWSLVALFSMMVCLVMVLSFAGADAEKKVQVAIDPGHGGQDSGSTYDGVEEKNLNLNIALYLAEELDNRGISYVMTREDDSFVALGDRAYIANDAKAELFISIHHNAIKNATSANGTETLYYPNSDEDCKLSGEELASIIQKHLITELGTRDRGVISRPNLAVIRKTNMPACIAEIGYLSNANERGLLVSDNFQRLAAKALANAIEEALGRIEE